MSQGLLRRHLQEDKFHLESQPQHREIVLQVEFVVFANPLLLSFFHSLITGGRHVTVDGGVRGLCDQHLDVVRLLIWLSDRVVVVAGVKTEVQKGS